MSGEAMSSNTISGEAMSSNAMNKAVAALSKSQQRERVC